jgi:fluoride exporter
VTREDRQLVVLVGLGSLAGGLLRYLLALPWLAYPVGSLPAATLLANVIGCLLIGFWFALSTAGRRWYASQRMQAAVMAGFCGGLTTFSVFSLETLMLIEAGHFLLAAGYVFGSLPLWLLAVWVGHAGAVFLAEKLGGK